MFFKNLLKIIILVLSCVVIYLVNSGLIFNVHHDAKVMTMTFALMVFLLLLYSSSCAKSLEIVGTLLYFISTTCILISSNFFLVICSWELASLSAILILSSNCKDFLPILRYSCIHFIGGVLIVAAIPYELIFTQINLVPGLLSNTQLTLLAIGILINCAVFPVSIWVTESYPAASPYGSAVLQIFVTKSALFLLFYMFHQCEILITVGFVTAIYALVYSLWETQLRKILAYNTVGQMGLLIASVGFGANIIPYLLSSIVYQTNLYLIVSTIIYVTGKGDLRELGGLFKKLPILGISALIALFVMSALPATVSFNAKHIIMESVDSSLLLIVFLVINYGLIMSCGIRLIYFTFFNNKLYSGELMKVQLGQNFVIIMLSLLSCIPFVEINSAYSFITVFKQIFFFIVSFIVFYLFRKPWYNANYRLISVDFVYQFIINILSNCSVFLGSLWKRVYYIFNKNIMEKLDKLCDINFENISSTLLCTIIIIGILISLYV